MQLLVAKDTNRMAFARGIARLSLPTQFAAGIGAALVLAGSFVLTGSFLLAGLLLVVFMAVVTVRSPVASLLAFIFINIFLTVRTKDVGSNNAPGGLDLAMGIILISIMCYWFVRLRLFESSSLSASAGQLVLFLFGIWSVVVTGIGLFEPHFLINNAIREMLNFVPLLILPVLYSRFIEIDSREERWIFISVLIVGIFMVVWNFYRVRTNIVRAYYLFQVGRGNSDEMLSALLILIATAMLMRVRGFWRVSFAAFLLCLGFVGVVISFARTLYFAAIVGMAVVVWLGNREERWRGIRNLAIAGAAGVAVLIPLIYTSRLIRLLLMHYGARFASSQHLGTDTALLERYIEWRYELKYIFQNPIFGHGFGSLVRVFDLAAHAHSWMGFSHSSYLYILMKTGLIGAILFFGAYFSFLYKGFSLLRSSQLTPLSRLVIRAGVGYLVAMLIYCYAAPVLNSKTDLVWVALIWGYFLALERSVKVASAPLILKEAHE